jgi:hypothetical protein
MTFSRILTVDLIQMKGFGSALWFSSYSRIALLSWVTRSEAPQVQFRVISVGKRSTRLGQAAEIGVKMQRESVGVP